jgi:membrane protease YdiL (CAAX protease family)
MFAGPVAFGIATVCVAFGAMYVGASVVPSILGQVAGARIAIYVAQCAQAYTVLPVALFAARFQPLPFAEIFRLRAAPAGTVGWALLGQVGLMAVIQLYLTVQDLYLVPTGLRQWYHQLVRDTDFMYREQVIDGGGIALGLLAAVVIAPVVEELLLRGLVQRSFERSMAPRAAVLAAACLFGAIHLQPQNMVAITGLGIYYGFLARRTRSILPSMATHALLNLGMSAALLLLPPELVTAGHADASSLPLMVPAAIGGALLLWVCVIRIARRHPAADMSQPIHGLSNP